MIADRYAVEALEDIADVVGAPCWMKDSVNT